MPISSQNPKNVKFPKLKMTKQQGKVKKKFSSQSEAYRVYTCFLSSPRDIGILLS